MYRKRKHEHEKFMDTVCFVSNLHIIFSLINVGRKFCDVIYMHCVRGMCDVMIVICGLGH